MDEKRIPVERGSGNVFADVGLPEPEGWLRKAERLLALRTHLRERRLSTARAALLLDASAEEVGLVRRSAIVGLSHQRVDEMFARLSVANAPLQHAEGPVETIAATPLAAIPTRELWLHRNPDALTCLERGLGDAAAGRVRDSGDFTRFLDEED